MDETPRGTGAGRRSRTVGKKSAKTGSTSHGASKAVRRTVKNLASGSSVRESGTTSRYHGFVSVQSRGTVALPPEVRRRYGLNEPGSQVEITERSDGILELRPTIAIPASQQWFWEKRWQEGERRADADIAAGRTTTYNNVDDFMESLDIGE